MIRVTAALAAALCVPVFAQRPSPAQQSAFIEKARQVALHYSDMLPDFVCTEVIQRSWGEPGILRKNHDSLTMQLSYFQKKESYKLVSSGGLMGAPLGASSSGEFGSALRWIFEPESAAEFRWEKSASVRGTRAAVYSYRVPRDRSRYVLSYGVGENRVDKLVAFHGVLQIAEDTGMTLRLTYEADNIPADFPIRKASNSVDYGYAEVGGRQYLLPARANSQMIHFPNRLLEMRSGAMRQTMFDNETEFRSYRKFEANSTIDFGDGKF